MTITVLLEDMSPAISEDETTEVPGEGAEDGTVTLTLGELLADSISEEVKQGRVKVEASYFVPETSDAGMVTVVTPTGVGSAVTQYVTVTVFHHNWFLKPEMLE